MLVSSVIYGWGFDFMLPFQNEKDTEWCLFCFAMSIWFEPAGTRERAHGARA